MSLDRELLLHHLRGGGPLDQKEMDPHVPLELAIKDLEIMYH